MTNTAKDTSGPGAVQPGLPLDIDPGPLKWTRKHCWGSVGYTYRAEVTLGDETLAYVVDQPRKGFWVLRGWLNGEFNLYRDGKTAKAMKASAADQYALLGPIRRQVVQR